MKYFTKQSITKNNTILFIILLTALNCYPQSESRVLRLKINTQVGFSSLTNKLVTPFLAYDLDFISESQNTRPGFEVTTALLKDINKTISIGLTSNISSFGFTDNEAVFSWGIKTDEYAIDRQFVVLGFGTIGSINLLKDRLNRLSISPSIRYENVLSTKGIHLKLNDRQKSAFSIGSSVEYGHRISKTAYVVAGFSYIYSINSFFRNLAYKPHRYGITIGVDIQI